MIRKNEFQFQGELLESTKGLGGDLFGQDRENKYRFLSVMSIVDALAVIFFSVVCFYFSRDLFSLSFFLLGFIFLLINRISLIKGNSFEQGSSFFLLIRLFIIALLLGQEVAIPFLPVLFIFSTPMAAFFLKGKNGGLKWMAGLLGILILVFGLRAFGLKLSYFSLNEGMHFVSTLILITVFLWFFELKKEQHTLLIRKQLYYDGLTSLPNRNSLLKDVDEMIAPALVLVNIDGFKEINDIFGYRVGDFVLMEFGKRIQEFVPAEAKGPYRISADEFAVLQELYGKHDTDAELKDLVQRSSEWPAREWIEPEHYKIQLQVTAGVASSLVVGSENLITRADIALKTAKKQHRSFLFYKDAAQTKKNYEENIKWAKILTDALNDNRVTAYYQPILNNHTDKIEKFECLVRLIDEKSQVISPYYFLDIAKQSRQYSKITRIMMQSAMETFKSVDAEFSINLSVEDILDQNTREFLSVAMELYPVQAKRTVFEILESEGIENYDEVSSFIRRMKEYGCQFAVDDFGTGYSNFVHILKLDVDYLKIDGSLIKKLDEDKRTAIVVENIVDFSSKLGLKTIAEFVHSEAILKKVKELGIDYSQGYFIDEALPKPRF